LASTLVFLRKCVRDGKARKKSRQLFISLRKLQNTGNWKRKCWIAISLDYAVEEAFDLSCRLRYNANKYATGWKAEKELFASQHRQGRFI